MSYNDFGDVSERENVCIAEAPLPSYEEVVAASNSNRKFKTDALLGSAAVSRSDRVERRIFNNENRELHYEPTHKTSKKAVILVLLGLILIPMCAMIITIQVKICTAQKEQETEHHDIERINRLYSRCVYDKTGLQRDFDGLSHNFDLLRDRYDLLNSKNEYLESNLRDIEKQLKVLTEEKISSLSTQTHSSYISNEKSNSTNNTKDTSVESKKI